MRTFIFVSVIAWMSSSANASETAPAIRTLAIPVQSPPARHAAPTGPTVLFLNRAQTTMKAGNDDSANDVSSVVQQQGLSQAMLPAFAGTDANWQKLVACMRDMYSRWNVVVTDQRPTQPGYIQAHIGGNGSEMSFQSGTGGVAPIDSQNCNNIPSAIVYVFSDVYKTDVQGMCEAGAQEIGHAFSLDHEYLCQDPMTYLQGCGAKTFQDVDASCGESNTRACICGRATQNSVQILTQRLGPAIADTTPPMVTVTSPADGAMLDGNAWTIVAAATDNVAVTKIELHLDDTSGSHVSACGDNTLPCMTASGTTTWQLAAGSGMRTFSVWAYDAAGNVGKSASRTVTLGKPNGGTDGGATADGGNGAGGGSGTGGNGSNGNGGGSGSRGGDNGGCTFAVGVGGSGGPCLLALLTLLAPTLRRRKRG